MDTSSIIFIDIACKHIISDDSPPSLDKGRWDDSLAKCLLDRGVLWNKRGVINQFFSKDEWGRTRKGAHSHFCVCRSHTMQP